MDFYISLFGSLSMILCPVSLIVTIILFCCKKKKTANKWLIITAFFLVIFGICLSMSICSHEWLNANCTNPKQCIKCNETEGDPLGHSWLAADCENPNRCENCSIVEGSPLGHEWVEATCGSAKTCSICQKKEGSALGHQYQTIEVLQEENCSTAGKYLQECTVCNRQRTLSKNPTGHEIESSTYKCIVTQKCKNCDFSKETEQHQEWYFTSTYYIDTCNIEKLSFNGTLTCKGCWKTKEGTLKCSASEFEKTFCNWVNYGNYNSIARYPEDNTNYVMKFTGYILQDCGNNLYRMSTNGRYDDVIMVEFVGTSNGRILEDDRVTVYGEPDLLYTYTSTLGAKITIPKFIAYYIHY